jgi:hypothetical protein
VHHYFVKVINRSRTHDIEITDVWFDADPPYISSCRSAPYRRGLDLMKSGRAG